MPGPKPVNVSVIDPRLDEAGEPQEVAHIWMAELIARYHTELVETKIVLMWRRKWKPVQGKLTLGQAKILDDSVRQISGNDVIIYLNEEWWGDPNTTDSQKRAVLDHELCHVKPVEIDEEGELRRDEHNNLVYRARPHDIQEFNEVIDRHGLYIDDLERTAAIMIASENQDSSEEASNSDINLLE